MLATRDTLSGDVAPRNGRAVHSASAAVEIDRRLTEPGDNGRDSDADYSRWRDLVRRIEAGDGSGMEELYLLFAKGIRFFLCRQLGPQEMDDKVHDTFLIVVRAIRRGELREPERLMGFVRTVARRQVAASIDRTARRRRQLTEIDAGSPISDGRPSPEERFASRQKIEIMKDALSDISTRDREILVRFYLREQSQAQICEEMGLTETQFRLLKSRAKARLGEIGKKKVQRQTLPRFSLRESASGGH